MRIFAKFTRLLFSIILPLCWLTLFTDAVQAQTDDPSPPQEPVKVIFIHHSTGENWLQDGYGDLGITLDGNNYFVSDTNYGWGPDSIGDRTDIPDWMEWFRGEESATYLQAIYTESDQNLGDFGSWPRLSDPGGENEIILFKSCFPNSELGGNPHDPPGDYPDYTVAGAKYVYNQLLEYFATRPDRLFIVITAPPVSDSANAENARAFNNWLVYDWLAENDYPYNNVAVFDYYNILTGPNNHHRYVNGQIEHTYQEGMNTNYYPSYDGDDHPSQAGNRKATEEFIPLLNIFYHRWQAGSAQLPPVEVPPAAPGEEEEQEQPGDTTTTTGTVGSIADFETRGTTGWEAYRDESTPSEIACAPQSGTTYAGSGALQIDFNIPSGTWGTCELPFDSAQNWSTGTGISFYIHADQVGTLYDVLLFSGTNEEWATYLYYTETPSGSSNDWVRVDVSWGEFLRADWETDAGTPFTNPERVFAIAFGVDGLDEGSNTGTLWIDDLQLLGVPEEQEQPGAEEQAGEEEGGGLPCLGGLLLPILFVCLAWSVRRK